MKSLKDIENISFEELEAVSLNEDIKVPEGFEQRLESSLDLRFLTDRIAERPRRTMKLLAAAASVALLIGLGIGTVRWYNEPEDTFDDPYMAYAELEKAFAAISDSVGRGRKMVAESDAIIDRTVSALYIDNFKE
ncbi:MAG: hypothetical protein IJB38_07590 [Bacteroidales bacterium]|nr:hypothetical protein [Bacteroidales bacterium]